MTTYELVNKYVAGKINKGKAASLKVVDNKLYNYNTLLAVITDDYIYLNKDKYSKTTSKHQNRIRQAIPKSLLKEVTEQQINLLK